MLSGAAMTVTSYAAATLENGVNGDKNHDVQVMSSGATVYSVDIVWGSMDYEYKRSAWDPATHTYGNGGLCPVDPSDGAMITVTNHSNADVIVKAVPILTGDYEKLAVDVLFDKYTYDIEYGEEWTDPYTTAYFKLPAGVVDKPDEATKMKFRLLFSNPTDTAAALTTAETLGNTTPAPIGSLTLSLVSEVPEGVELW